MAGVGLLFGPLLIGVLLNTTLYGVLVVQTFIYYQTYKNDKPWIRYLILYLFILETMNTGFDIGFIYEPLIVRYGTPEAIILAPINPISTVMISTPVQLFIAWRIKIITKSKLLAGAISFLAICSFIGGVATTVSITFMPEYQQLLNFQQFDGAVITWLSSSAAADIIITVSLVISLHRKKTGFRATDDVINKIIRLSVQTGMITAISAAADVIIFLAVPSTTLNFIWDLALSKLYTNALLSTLNARAGWNNLTGSDQDNVLFGDDLNSTRLRTFQCECGSNPSEASNQQQIIRGAYRLKPHINTSSECNTKKNTTDFEYGISITKVVERLEDPSVSRTSNDGSHPSANQM